MWVVGSGGDERLLAVTMACTSFHRSLMMLSLASRSIAFFPSSVCSPSFMAKCISFTAAFAGSPSRSYYSTSQISSHTLRQPLSSSLYAIRGGNQNDFSSGKRTTNELPMFPLPSAFEERRTDVAAAITAVFAACKVTRHVQPSSSNNIETISKQDASPVTVGDFASQALVLQMLHHHFPFDMFIAEEGSEALQKDEELLVKVWEAINHDHGGLFKSKEHILRAIDYGQGMGLENYQQCAESKRRRVWCLDPIDGTKGFLRGRVEGGQFCIALALLEDGEPMVSVLGCPNLPFSSTQAASAVPFGLWSENEIQESLKQETIFSTTRGSMFVAVRGHGCYEIPLHQLEKSLLDNAESVTTSWTQLRVTPNDGTSKPLEQAKFCLGVERDFSDPKGTILKIASLIHGPNALCADSNGILVDITNSLRMDGQGKYGLLARGDAEYFVRLPKDGYIDFVWDVAAGFLVLKEAGGHLTDLCGHPIEFSEIGVGRRSKLPVSVKGILGSCGGLFHRALVDAYRKVEQTS